MNEQQERADFEATMKGVVVGPWMFDAREGKYSFAGMRLAWMAWKARAALAAQGVPADLVRAAESIEAAVGTLADGLEGHLEALNAPLIALRAALAATPSPPQSQQSEGYVSQSALDWLADPMRGQRSCITTTIYRQPEGSSNTPIYTHAAMPAQAQAPRAFRIPDQGTPWWQTAKDCGAWTDRQEGDVGYVHFGSTEALRVYTFKISEQARMAEPLTAPHPGSDQASKAIDAELEARGWPTNTKNAARAGYEACRKLAGIAASSEKEE